MVLGELIATFFNTTEAINNNDNAAVLYKKTVNTGSIAIKPSADAIFKPVENPPKLEKGKFDPGGSVFYIRKFESIMTPAAVAAVRFGDGWTAKYYSEDGGDGGYWAISPKTEIRVPAGKSLIIPVTNISVDDGKDHSHFSCRITYYDVEGITSKSSNYYNPNRIIALRNPPDVPLEKLSKYVSASFKDGYELDWKGHKNVEMIRTTTAGEGAIHNSFTLALVPIPGEVTKQATAESVFKISFAVASEAFGALVSKEDFAQIHINSDRGWHPQPHLDSDQPFWEIEIPAGSPISGNLTFSNVVSHLDVGFCDILLHWEAVPGCEDGEFWLPVYKFGPTVCKSYGAWQFISLSEVQMFCRLNWDMENVSRVMITSCGQTLVDTSDSIGSSSVDSIYPGDNDTAIFSACPLDLDPGKRAPVEMGRSKFLVNKVK